MKVALVVLLTAVLAAGLLLMFQPWGGGVVFIYKIQCRPEHRSEAADRILAVLKRRLDAYRVRCSGRRFADGRVELRIADVRPEGIACLRELLERRGRVELRATAELGAQEEFLRSRSVPGGFIAAKETLIIETPYDPWCRGEFLLSDPPALATEDVQDVKVSVVYPHTLRLYSSPEVVARVDSWMESLSRRTPPGLIAVIMDQRIFMATWSPGIDGNAIDIAAPRGSYDEARGWSASILGGELPYLLDAPEVDFYRGRLR